ncbi:polysaccharide biosynthesis/export family protein [Paraburkholderia aspalathi]|uniref:Polysaccharide export outer membrane protein n=1 Tax=Paraburkholderia aspalathi TaxID=1324617 RepID=A0A1I7ELR4_9BURK|nr:polysaccharide biosynthesis/export family protein [Paraburkholderia aspalathi]SFU24821.1 polysaccharide export outer membrane protein [Paraburkholderia aspalathi]
MNMDARNTLSIALTKFMYFKLENLKMFIAACAMTALSGCVFAPGMKFDAGTPLDASTPASVPSVIDITPTLVAQNSVARRKTEMQDAGYSDLLRKPPIYKIGPADVLSIIVWDHPELVMPNITYTIGSTSGNLPTAAGLSTQSLPGYIVSQDGYIQFPYIGTLKVAGLTEVEANRVLTAQLDKYLKSPQITLRVIGYRSQKVFIDGEVRGAGLQSITDMPMTLPLALNEAGGIASTGDPTRIALSRSGKTYTISIPQLVANGVNPNDIGLLDNDVLHIPQLLDSRVYVMGEVTRQSAVPFRSDGRLSLSEALGDAGGVNPVSADPNGIYVIRPIAAGAVPLVYRLESRSPTALGLAQNFQLQAGDLVYVEAAGVVRWNRLVSQLVGGTTGAYYLQHTITPN